MQTTLVNLRLEKSYIETLDKLAGKGLNRQAVARMLLIAAVEAVQKNQGRLEFPPQFTVGEPPATVTYNENPRREYTPTKAK